MEHTYRILKNKRIFWRAHHPPCEVLFNLTYHGNPPQELGSETAAELPEGFRIWDRYYDLKRTPCVSFARFK